LQTGKPHFFKKSAFFFKAWLTELGKRGQDGRIGTAVATASPPSRQSRMDRRRQDGGKNTELRSAVPAVIP